MEIKLHRDFSEIEESLWDRLLSQSATNVPFLKYGYLMQWWLYRGGGEWPQEAQLFILSGWDGSDLKGIAPLFSVKENGQDNLYLLGSIEISDYLDFIAHPDDLEGFISSLLAFINDSADLSNSLLTLVNIPDNSPTNSLLQSLGPKFGWTVKIENAHHAPAISLAGDWDTYLAGIDKKQRHEIRRKLRKADESAEVKWYFVNDPLTLDAEINAFFDLMVLDEAKKKFLTSQMRDQMRAIILWAFEAGLFQLSFLTIEGVKAASYLCFDYNENILVYNSGFDFRFSQYSPGWVLLGYLIQDAIQNRKKCFDFMRGGEDYKYRFGAANSFVMRVELLKAKL
jgi:CelD/BcsL family acetyltransferase involved in cellulose biosynthesis